MQTKKFLSILLAVIMVIGLVPGTVFAVEGTVTVNSQSELDAALTSEATQIIIEGGSYIAKDDYETFISVPDGKTLVINGGTFDGYYKLIGKTGAGVTINDCTYNNGTAVVWGAGGEIVINGGTFNSWAICVADSYTAKITINGGTFDVSSIDANTGVDLKIKGGSFSVDPTNFVAEGYTFKKDDNGQWNEIVCVAQIGTTKYETLAEAIEAAVADDTITLLTDYAITGTGTPWTVYKLPEGATLDLNSKTLQIQFGQALFAGKNITIKNGTVTPLESSNADYALYLGSTTSSSQTVSIETSVTLENIVSPRSGINALWESEVTLKDCFVTVNPARTSSYAVVTNNRASVTIESGTYNGSTTYKHDVSKGTGATVTIKGGSFLQTVDEANVAEGYFVNKDSAGRYVVSLGDPIAEVNGKKYMTLQEAINAAPEYYTIVILRDFNEDGVAVAADDTLIIDLNGKTVDADIMNYGNLSVMNGTINNTNSGASAIENNGAGATLTVENLDITSARHALRIDGGDATIQSGSYATTAMFTVYAVNISSGATVEIIDGTFKGAKATTATTENTAALSIRGNSTVTIANGNFSGGSVLGTLQCDDTSTISITGGTFDQDPSAYVATGYTATATINGFVVDKITKATFSVTADKAEVKTGEVVNITVTLSGEDLIGGAWTLSFDPEKFEQVGTEALSGEFVRSYTFDSEVIATYTFRAIAQVDASVVGTFTVTGEDAYDYNGAMSGKVESTVTPANVTIKHETMSVSVLVGTELQTADSKTIDWDGKSYTVAIVPSQTGVAVSYKVNGEDVSSLTFSKSGTYAIDYTVTKKGYADVTGTFVFTINEIQYVVEVNLNGSDTSDYVAGKKLVLVYTNNEGLSFTYSGKTMYDVTVAGYKHNSTDAYEHVYAIVVDAIDTDGNAENGAQATLDDYKTNVKPVETALADSYVVVYSNDLNNDGSLTLRDVGVAYGVLNQHEPYFINFMANVLMADTNGDKIVDESDAANVKKAYDDSKAN